MTASKGRILQLQNYSVNDGEGIRTIVFFAGCPLRCRWCANPEGYSAANRILYIASRCVHCGRCVQVCPHGVGMDLQDASQREKCDGCGKCVDACLEQARKNTVTEYTVQEILDRLEKQSIFFRNSGGGVTYSGGECTLQKDFLHELAQQVYDMGFDQAMETSACFDLDELQPTLDLMDLLFIDIKHMDTAEHHRFTGMDNHLILQNIARLGQSRSDIIIRVPTIMGVNGSDENIIATARFVKENLKKPRMELLPYHSYGADKYAQLGMPYDDASFRTPTARELQHLQDLVRREGVEIVSYK